MSDLTDSGSEYRSRRRRYGSPAPNSHAPFHQSSRRISGTQSPAAHQYMLLEVPVPRTTIAHLYVGPHQVRSQGAFSSLLTITRTTARQTRCGQAFAGAPHPRAFRQYYGPDNPDDLAIALREFGSAESVYPSHDVHWEDVKVVATPESPGIVSRTKRNAEARQVSTVLFSSLHQRRMNKKRENHHDSVPVIEEDDLESVCGGTTRTLVIEQPQKRKRHANSTSLSANQSRNLSVRRI